MKQRFVRSARLVLITLAVIGLTSVTVDATLTGGGISQSALGILATRVAETMPPCGDGMIKVMLDTGPLCVDEYEASPGPLCPRTSVGSTVDTRTNIDVSACKPQSKDGGTPWTFVTLNQAQELCARAGKRLIDNANWYRTSLGSPDVAGASTCNVRGQGIVAAGADPDCVSGSGIHDMIGNVWEWVDGTIERGSLSGTMLPDGGYVAEANADGVVTKTSDTPNPDYHLDYAWLANDGTYGILRGGFYGSGDDAGLYTIQGKTAPSFSGGAIGFRCVSDIAG